MSTLRPWPPGPACGAPHPPTPGHRSQEALGAVACRCCRSFRLAWETWLLPSLPLSLRGPGPSSPAALGMHVYLEGRREEGLLTSSDLLCVGFLRSVWSAHPEEPSRRQRDQDPLPHCQEDASVPSQRPPGSPVPALLAGTAALPIQVGGSRLGCHGPELATQKCWAHSLLAEEWARFSVQRSLSRHTAGPCGLRARTREPPHCCQEAASWWAMTEGTATIQTGEVTPSCTWASFTGRLTVRVWSGPRAVPRKRGAAVQGRR